jgi:hypothetical protein
MCMLRMALLATALLAAFAAAVAAAPTARTVPTFRLSVTGEIEALGPPKIAIGRVACAIPPRLEQSAGRYVIGDPVKMTCREGTLEALRYSPELATAQSNGPAAAAPPSAATPRASGGTTSFSATFAQIALSTGVVTTSTTGPLSSASGTVDALDSTSITVNGLTCSIPSLLPSFVPMTTLAVGWKATLTCHSDTGLIASLSARSG